MSPRARTWAAAALLALVAGGALAFGQLSGTFAIFTADTENQNSALEGSWIPAPSGLSASIGGSGNSQAVLNWTSGASAGSPSPNPVTGQTLLYADGGSGSSASCGSYSSFASLGAAVATDTITGTQFTDWWCFEIQSTSTSATTSGSWTSAPVAFATVQALVPTSIVFNHAAAANGKIDIGDSIVITFNQAVNTSSVSVNSGICQVKGTSSNGYVIIGFSGTCSSGASYGIGKITGITVGKTGSASASASWSAGNTVLTVTATSGGQNVATGGTFVAATAIQASAGSPSVCTAAACTLTPSGSF